MNDLSLQQLLLRFIAMVVLVGVHGFALAAIARLLGDEGPAHDGRLTLNPVMHLDLLGMIGMLVGRLGWIKPMAIDAARLRAGRAGLILCWIGSLAITLLFGVLVLQLRWLTVVLVSPDFASHVVVALLAIAESSIWFVAFNLIPVPPLAGGLLLAAVAPAAFTVLQRHSIWISVALIAFSLVTGGAWLRPMVDGIKWALAGQL